MATVLTNDTVAYGGTAFKMIRKLKRIVSRKKSDPAEPETSPTGGSGAEERLRAAEYEEGRGAAREGAERLRDDEQNDLPHTPN
jgi:hypothetical protein